MSNEFIVNYKTERSTDATNVKILVFFKTECSSSMFSKRGVGVSFIIISRQECDIISSEQFGVVLISLVLKLEFRT